MNHLLTPYIVQTIIICCTIIIALVGLSGYRIKKQLKQSWQGYTFIASILTIFVIMIFSYLFYEDRNVLDFVSLSSALISIILAIVTIIYSFYSNSSAIGQTKKLQKAAKNVEEASVQYGITAKSLHDNISRILSKLDGIEAKVSAGVNTDYENQIRSQVTTELTEELLKNFVIQCSSAGLLMLYACFHLLDNHKTLDLKALVDEEKAMYYIGFLVATNSIGISAIEIDAKDMIIKKVYRINPGIRNMVSQRINEECAMNESFKEFKEEFDQYFSK